MNLADLESSAMSEDAPGHAGELVSERDGKDVVMQSLLRRFDPKVTDLPLPSPAIEALALEAMSGDLDIGGLIGQVLVAAINKDMIQEILR